MTPHAEDRNLPEGDPDRRNAPVASAAEAERRSAAANYKWWVVGLLCLSGCINYMDRQAVFAVFPLLRAEFGASDAVLSLLGTAFLWVYALSSPLAGYCGDRFSRKRVIIVSLAIFSLVTFSTGFASAAWNLIALRMLLGVSEALYMPVAVAYISDWHSERSRGLAVGLHQASLLVGGMGGATIAGFVGDAYGWRPTFWALGGGGLLLGLLFWLALREVGKGSSDSAVARATAVRSAPLRQTIGLIGRTPSAVCLIINSFVVSMVTWIILVWMPSYLHDRFSLSLGAAAFNGTVWASVAGLIALPTGGVVADRWVQRNPGARPLVQVIGLALLVPAMLCIGFAGSMGPVLVGLALYGAGQAIWNSGNMPILCEVTPPAARSTAYGLINFTGTFGGGISVLLFAGAAKWAGVGAVFGALAGLVLLSLVLTLAMAFRFHARDRLGGDVRDRPSG